MPIPTIQNPMFQPAMREISAITKGTITIITTTINHNYQNGLIVRILIPYNYGMTQINGQDGIVTRINATQFSLPIDSTYYDDFVIPALPNQFPEVIPFAEINANLDQPTRNVLPNNILP